MGQFDNLFPPGFKQLHEDAIAVLLEEDGCCAVPCLITYPVTKFTTCTNCRYDVIGGKSSSRYVAGGPIPFYQGNCPMCNGESKIPVVSTDIIYALPLWNSKDWILSNPNINVADIVVQTMSKTSLTKAQIMRAGTIQIDTNLTNYGVPPFVRKGDTQFLGMGSGAFIITSWGRA